jgi:hypothetical protein
VCTYDYGSPVRDRERFDLAMKLARSLADDSFIYGVGIATYLLPVWRLIP